LRLSEIGEQVVAGDLDGKQAHAAAQALRAQIDALKWQAAHEAPKAYGGRVQLANDEQNPVGGVSLASLMTIEELTAMRRRLVELEQGKMQQ
jgi:hypothetical protein